MRWLDRFDLVPPILLAVGPVRLRRLCSKHHAPGLGCTAMQMLIWGFFISTVAVYHVTYLVNSATHVFGTPPLRDQGRQPQQPWSSPS